MGRWHRARLGIVLLLACQLAAGCAAPGLDSPEARATQLRDDAFLPYHEVTTATLSNKSGLEVATMRLIGRRDRKTAGISTHAVVGIYYHQKLGRHYEAARNAAAELLPMRRLRNDGAGCRKADGCIHFEEFMVDIPEAQLRQALAAGRGYPIKLFGRAGGGTEYPIPPVLVASLMAALDATPPAAAGASTTRPLPR